jgi:ribosomal protein S18 acetylase RimI-like enzyme
MTPAPEPPGADWLPRRLAASDLGAVAAVWNATFAPALPLGARALATWWGSRHTDPGLTFGVERGGRLVGVLLARAPAVAWAPRGLAHVSLLAVAPEAQRSGAGAALWRTALAALRPHGVTHVRLGADPGHLLPGVPAAAPDAAWRFLRRRGVAFGGIEADLHVDLRPGPPSRPSRARLIDDDPEAVVAFVERAFPGRWADDVAGFARAGCTVLGLEHGGEIVAFAAAFGPDDAVVGPSLTWAEALPGPVAGVGPLGVGEAHRGLGLGLGIVAEAARWHHARGALDLLIDWTTLAAFYGRLGARLWRAYQRAEIALDGGR